MKKKLVKENEHILSNRLCCPKTVTKWGKEMEGKGGGKGEQGGEKRNGREGKRGSKDTLQFP